MKRLSRQPILASQDYSSTRVDGGRGIYPLVRAAVVAAVENGGGEAAAMRACDCATRSDDAAGRPHVMHEDARLLLVLRARAARGGGEEPQVAA